jgi:broad specificity phosphatase PhoE
MRRFSLSFLSVVVGLGCHTSASNVAFFYCTPKFGGNRAHSLSLASSVSFLHLKGIPIQGRKVQLSAHCVSPSPSSSSSSSVHTRLVKPIIMGPELPPIDRFAKRLFLVRHGEVVNPGGDRPVYYGAMEVPLSPLGEAEATAAASYLKTRENEIDLVVSSPLSRATFGANVALKMQSFVKESSVITMDGFKELDRGSWCGQTKDQIGPEMMARFDACDESVTPVGGESYPSLKRRVLEARDDVLKKLPCGRAAIIVSHLQVTRSILSEALDIPIEKMAGLKVTTGSLTCIDYDTASGSETVHFQSFKPDLGLQKSRDGAN